MTRGEEIEPGIYSRSDVDYASIVAINQSTLKHISKSPLHMRHRARNPKKSTGSMRLGSLAHTAILEPDRLEHEYAVYKAGITIDGVGTSKTDVYNGKVYDAFAEENAGRTIVKVPEMAAALRVREAVHDNKLAARYLYMGRAEQILVWRDQATGILCKARLDWISDSVRDVLVELKTAADISRRMFQKQFAKLQYDVQTAWYCMGFKALTGRQLFPKAIAVENTEPHDVIVYDLIQVVDRGEEIARGYLDLYARCRNAGQWPGQASEELLLELPFWRLGEDEDEEDDFLGTLRGGDGAGFE